VSDLSGLRAVSGEGGDNLGHVCRRSSVGGRVLAVGGSASSHGGNGESGSETHVERVGLFVGR